MRFYNVYGQGFSFRPYTEGNIRKLNRTNDLIKVFEQPFVLINLIDMSEYDLDAIIYYLNANLKFDGYEIFQFKEIYKLKNRMVPWWNWMRNRKK
ncbi:hypothetical protein LCM23_21330 [Cytobacillus kochii]|uniref:hypothetical protein n=1 Tax=Cytobacillus kochii TaxID=859143 RepID=UPI001CD3503C|nr:hypothetical protein [Cytobacillus kochii]MCA1028615.1 hypothetical protein [Cytobacillus kochii]